MQAFRELLEVCDPPAPSVDDGLIELFFAGKIEMFYDVQQEDISFRAKVD